MEQVATAETKGHHAWQVAEHPSAVPSTTATR